VTRIGIDLGGTKIAAIHRGEIMHKMEA